MAEAEDVYESAADIRACLSDLTKIPQKEFEKQFRGWMERDGVARALQAKLRSDLITNFNRTSLGKRILAQTSTNRLTLSPTILALNTLVAEFLFSQNCHFSLSVFCTEIPFRNTLPDFENMRHFRFKEAEITEIFTALSGTIKFDWHANKKIARNYAANASTSLLFFVLKALLEKNEESTQQKVTIGTNTRPFRMSYDQQHNSGGNTSLQEARPDTKADLYNTNFRYLNKYLIILSKKVKEMSERFENLQKQNICIGAQPRVRVMKSSRRRKYEDLNRSLERVTENLKQMATAKRKSKQVGIIVKAIETLAIHFQKCAENFENVSKDLRVSGSRTSRTQMTNLEKSVSAETLRGTPATVAPPVTATTAASQTDLTEKTYRDWVHEMRYTPNGQKFLDRVEKSLRKAMEKQKNDLKNEMEVKLRHQRELLRIRYKQKLIEQLYVPGTDNPAGKRELNESISEQFRQFEIKHFDLLNKIYESEAESKPAPLRIIHEIVTEEDVPQKPPTVNERPLEKLEVRTVTGCGDHEVTTMPIMEQPQYSNNLPLTQSALDIHKQVRAAVEEIVEEERNVDQIVYDAKLRIKELEQESNQLTEHFLGYLDRQREQKLAAREAAHSLWKDYMCERDKMKDRYILTEVDEMNPRPDTLITIPQKPVEVDKNQNLIKTAKSINFGIDFSGSTSSDGSSSYLQFTNPIIQAKEDFFERERKFKAEAERVLNQGTEFHFNDDMLPKGPPPTTNKVVNSFNRPSAELNDGSGNDEAAILLQRKPQALLVSNLMAHLLSDSLSGTGTDLSPLWTASNRTNGTNATTITTTKARANIVLEHHGLQNYKGVCGKGGACDSGVNKTKRREIIATAEIGNRKRTKTILVTPTPTPTPTLTAATSTPTTTTKSNKSNNFVRGENGASVPEEHLNSYKIKNSSNDHKQYSQQSEWNQNSSNNNNINNNKPNSHSNSNNINTCKPKAASSTQIATTTTTATATTTTTTTTTTPTLTRTTVKSSKRGEGNRKAVLEQSMARMQQLFLPHHQHQQIMLDDVTEEEEEEHGRTTRSSASEKDEHSKSKTGKREKHKSNIKATNANGQQVVVSGDARSENVVSHYKNNLQLKQIPATITFLGSTTEGIQTSISPAINIRTATTLKTLTTSKEKEKEKEQQRNNDCYIKMKGRRHIVSDDVAAQLNGDMSKQSTGTRMPSNDEDKIIEAVPDWQQIACGAIAGRGNVVVSFKAEEALKRAQKQKAEEVEDGDSDDDDDEDKDVNANVNAVEPGEVIERNKEVAGISVTNTNEVPEAWHQLEIGELIENGAGTSAVSIPGFTNFLSSGSSSSHSTPLSSIDLQLSVGGGRSVTGNGISTRKHDDLGSDSGSDFWR